MARTTKKKENKVVTRAEKKDATKGIITELLAIKPQKHNELIEETAKLYTQRFGGEDTENINDVKGRVGSVLDIMKKDSDIAYEGGMYALKARLPVETAVETPIEKPAEKPIKKTRAKAKKVEEIAVEPVQEEQEKPKAKKTTKKAKTEEQPAEEQEKPKAKKTTKKQETIVEEKAEKTAPKKRVSKAKKAEKVEEKQTETLQDSEVKKVEEKPQEIAQETVQETPPTAVVVKEKAEIAKKPEVMDMSFLFGAKAPIKGQEKQEKTEQKAEVVESKEEKAQEPQKKNTVKAGVKNLRTVKTVRSVEKKPLTADGRLQESFLRKLRSLGGDYFEYYSVYLLERYSRKNGRRIESMKINGGDRDGGIDGEIEVTDKLGFRETIYIQSKNWNPDKGDEKFWVVGETLLQQFIGACAYRQAQEGKQHCRGIFITTSRFTPEAKRILSAMSDKIVGYDGEDLYEAAKDCQFGVVYENGNWKLDEKLLSGPKAFFNMV